MESFLAVVTPFAANFAPKNWALCNGQLLAIAQNQALFSILGTTYGGNGTTNFALPNLQGRVPVGQGTGPGLSPNSLGQSAGSAAVTLSISNLPPHIHNGTVAVTMQCDTSSGSEAIPEACYPAGDPNAYNANAEAGVVMKDPAYTNATVTTAGGNQAMNIMPPYLTVNYIICLAGIFPSRN